MSLVLLSYCSQFPFGIQGYRFGFRWGQIQDHHLAQKSMNLIWSMIFINTWIICWHLRFPVLILFMCYISAIRISLKSKYNLLMECVCEVKFEITVWHVMINLLLHYHQLMLSAIQAEDSECAKGTFKSNFGNVIN